MGKGIIIPDGSNELLQNNIHENCNADKRVTKIIKGPLYFSGTEDLIVLLGYYSFINLISSSRSVNPTDPLELISALSFRSGYLSGAITI